MNLQQTKKAMSLPSLERVKNMAFIKSCLKKSCFLKELFFKRAVLKKSCLKMSMVYL